VNYTSPVSATRSLVNENSRSGCYSPGQHARAELYVAVV